MYVENPFCDFVIGILWLGIKSLPRPLRKEGSTYAHTRGYGLLSLSQIISAKYLQTCLLPLRGGWVGLFEFYLSLCKTDRYNGICRTCYSSILKNDGFLKDSTYLCKQRKKEVLPSIIWLCLWVFNLTNYSSRGRNVSSSNINN